MLPLLIILGLLLLIGFWAMGTYNRLVKLRTLVEEAWSGINVQLKKRYDLIPNILETVKGYAAHERETFERVTAARVSAQKASSVQEQQQAENQLSQAMMNLFAVAENYPELKSNQNFLHLQSELSAIEGDIEKARRYYNGTVRDKNILIESFPSKLIADAFGFQLDAFFELDNPAEASAPQVKF